MSKTKAPCSVDTCDRPSETRGWCRGHYCRWRRLGDPGTEPINPYGRTSCSVDGCESPHFGRGYCKTHHYRWLSNGDPLVTRPPGLPVGEAPRAESVKYSAAHTRLKRARGFARDHSCAHCGLAADNWAYKHNDSPFEQVEDGKPYSTRMDDYMPLCYSCHWHFDRGLGEYAVAAWGPAPWRV